MTSQNPKHQALLKGGLAVTDEFEQYRVLNRAKNSAGDDFEQYRVSNQRDAQKSERMGFKGIKGDISESLSQLPEALMQTLASLPSEAYGAITHPGRSLMNVGAGLGEGAIGAFNLPGNITKYLSSKGILPEAFGRYAPHIGDLGIEKRLGLDAPQAGDALVRGLASFAPFARLGKFGQAGVAKRAGTLSAYAGGQNEDPIKTALLGELLGGAAKGVQGGVNKLRPSNLLRGELSPEQLQRNLDVTKGTETGLGRVIDHPVLNRFHENILPNVIGSGAEKTMQRTARGIQGKGQDVVEGMMGKTEPSDVSQRLQSALVSAAKEARNNKNALYGKYNKQAEKLGITTDRSNMRKTASSLLDEINSDPDLAKFTNNEDISLLKGIAKEGSKKEHSLKSTEILKGKIGNLAYEAWRAGEQPKVSLYKDLRDALEKDIDKPIESSKDPELKKLRQEAKDFYRKEFAPFESNDIVKFTREGGDPDLLLGHFLKTQGGVGNDRAHLLKRLISATEGQQKGKENLIAGAYFSRALNDEGMIDPIKLRSLYYKLGKNQRKVLLGNGELHNDVKRIAELTNKNNEAYHLLFNPKTGARLSQLFQIGATSAVGGGLSGFLGTNLALGAAGKLATKALTSEKVRESLVKKMIANQNKKPSKLPERARKLAPMELELTKYNRQSTQKDDQNGTR